MTHTATPAPLPDIRRLAPTLLAFSLTNRKRISESALAKRKNAARARCGFKRRQR